MLGSSATIASGARPTLWLRYKMANTRFIVPPGTQKARQGTRTGCPSTKPTPPLRGQYAHQNSIAPDSRSVSSEASEIHAAIGTTEVTRYTLLAAAHLIPKTEGSPQQALSCTFPLDTGPP